MAQPFISVVVNNYNYEAYLGAAIDSVLAQSYCSFECIVVDDGSTDASRDIIADYGDAIHPLFKANEGQTSAINAGYRASRGDLLCFLDADDLLAAGALQCIAEVFAQSGCVKAHWPMLVIDGLGRATGRREPPFALPSGDLRYDILRGGPSAAFHPPTSGNAFARRLLEAALPLPEIEHEHRLGSASADGFLSMLAPLYGTVTAIGEPQSYYRVHGSNDYAMLNICGRMRRNMLVTEKMCDALEEHCVRLGLPTDRVAWIQQSLSHQIDEARRQVEARIPQGGFFVLVDEDQWTSTLFEGRRAAPFLERDGLYFGLPADDVQAIGELERHRAAGAAHLVVASHSFWWLDHYQGLRSHLERNAACVWEGLLVRIFALHNRDPATACPPAHR
ncbi:MAG: glycosyltransferase family A protein [Phenylobacterium sp.]|uniref:glycosyltransferase family 2 protein n=1 Tax=Phenylobacterium sp. TaxID=1871053 RepID=UPI0027363577|nr:glycosyltransferase family A protein [Phenylobacterium sp.]MDP3175513.1 glycosyltransferase family A protein [Phenylobacterium sp.]